MNSSTVDVLVIGAGPYGLSTFAHLHRQGLRARIFGEPMRTWESHMPVGMFLKSTPAASNLAAGRPGFDLADYCRTVGVDPPTGDDPVPVDLFIRYGNWFTDVLAPTVERAEVRAVHRVAGGGFRIETSEGEEFEAGSVVVASGLIGHAYLPPELAALASDQAPAEAPVSHSSQHDDLAVFAGREVAVIGAGQSALESAALLAEAGARPTILARRSSVLFAEPPKENNGRGRSDRRQLLKPASPLGPGWSLYACTHGPALFRRLPDGVRLDLVARILGPAGAWWLRERVVDRIPVHTGQHLLHASVDGDKVALKMVGADGTDRTIHTDHVLGATGYRIGTDAFGFLSPDLRRAVNRIHGWPRLHAGFESSVPGLFFVGFPAAASFGPLMRFVCGTAYASPRLTEALAARTNDASAGIHRGAS
jgi:FAD-dependent urate hydroxylase